MTPPTPAILTPMLSMLFNGQPHSSSKPMTTYQCQPTKPIYTDYIEHTNTNNLTPFIYDESASEPGFDKTLACHLTQVNPFRAAAVLDLLADEPKRLDTIREVLKNHTSQEHYNFIIGASQMTLLNKKDGVSQSFKTIPENRLRTYILLGTHANSCRKLANNQPIPIFYKGVVYRAQVSGAICPPSIPEMTLMIADADYQPPISLADILKEIAKSDECFMSDKCLVDGVCDCETNDYNSNDDKE